MNKLNEHFASMKMGPVTDTGKLDRLLADCWDDLTGGDEGGMKAHKLLGRMEHVIWTPPVLNFVIERHGGTVCGSTRAELQHWAINLDNGEATIIKAGHRRKKPMAASEPIKATAAEIARLILDGRDEERLQWQTDRSVSVQARKIDPDGSGFNRTVEGRRRRLCQFIEKALAQHGWVKTGWNMFKSSVTSPDCSGASRLRDRLSC